MNFFTKKTIVFFEKYLGNDKEPNNENYNIIFIDFDTFAQTSFFSHECIEEYKNRYKRGDKCVALLVDNKIVNISWICFSNLYINEIQKGYEVPSNSFLIYDVFTLQEYRGKGYYKLIIKAINDWAKKNNYNKTYIYAESDNEISIKGIKSSGYTESGKITMINLLGFKIYKKE